MSCHSESHHKRLPWLGFQPQTWKRGIWSRSGTGTVRCRGKEGKRPMMPIAWHSVPMGVHKVASSFRVRIIMSSGVHLSGLFTLTARLDVKQKKIRSRKEKKYNGWMDDKCVFRKMGKRERLIVDWLMVGRKLPSPLRASALDDSPWHLPKNTAQTLTTLVMGMISWLIDYLIDVINRNQ